MNAFFTGFSGTIAVLAAITLGMLSYDPVLSRIQAQTPPAPSYLNTRCGTPAGGSTPAVGPNMAYLLYTGPTGYPLCLALGDGLRIDINPVTKMPTLRVVLSTNPIPTTGDPLRQVSESILVSNAGISDTAQWHDIKLRNKPAATTNIAVLFASSRGGLSWASIVTPDSIAPQSVRVSLPSYRPLTSADVFVVMYFTYDPL